MQYLTQHFQSNAHVCKPSIIPYCMFTFYLIECIHGAYVKLKDRKRSLSRKKRPQRVVSLEKQLQREILRCGSYSEDSEGFRLKVTCNV